MHEDDKGNFGVTFTFDEPSEREDVLRWMNLEPSIENQKMAWINVSKYNALKILTGLPLKYQLNACLKSGLGLSRPSIKVKWHMRKRIIYKV
nr:hypothetical protein P5627_00295 [Bacillus safensis]